MRCGHCEEKRIADEPVCSRCGAKFPKRVPWGAPGSHVTRRTTATVYSRGERPVIVTVYPDGTIGLRLNKTRREEFVSAASCYRRAVALRVAAEKEAKRKARKAK